MSKSRTAERVLKGIGPQMRPGEEMRNLVVAVVGPWQYVTVSLLLVSAIVGASGHPGGLAVMFIALLSSLRMRTVALALSDEAIYVARLRFGKDVTDPEVLRPVSGLRFERRFLYLAIEDRHYWIAPLYLGEDAGEFGRELSAASAPA